MASALRSLRPLLCRAALAAAVPRAVARSAIAARSFHGAIAALKRSDAKDELVTALKRELDDERQNGTEAELPTSYEDFSITTKSGSPKVELVSTVGKAKVTVSLNLNECPMTEGMPEEGEEPEASESDEDMPPAAPTPNFSIKIAHGDKLMVVQAGCYGGELQMQRVGFLSKATKEEDAYFCDAEFLDEELYDALREYLSGLGVDEAFCEFLEGYVADKEYHEYLQWLQRAPSFLS